MTLLYPVFLVDDNEELRHETDPEPPREPCLL